MDSNDGLLSGFCARHRCIKFFNSADKCDFSTNLCPVISSSFSNGKLPHTYKKKYFFFPKKTNLLY